MQLDEMSENRAFVHFVYPTANCILISGSLPMSKAYVEKHRKLGLCEKCPKPALPNRFRCEYHAKTQRLASQKQREKRRKEGRCVDCGRPALPGKVRCYCTEDKNNARYHDVISRRS